MTEQQRLAALEAFNNGFQTEQNGECFYTFPHDKTVLIREALQAPQPEVVTKAEFRCGCGHIGNSETRLLMARYIEHYYPHGLRIVKEKNDE